MAQAQTITPLRQRMLDDMMLRNMAASTRQIYVRSVADFSAFRCAVEPSSMVVRARMVQKPIDSRTNEGLGSTRRRRERQADGAGRPLPPRAHHRPDRREPEARA